MSRLSPPLVALGLCLLSGGAATAEALEPPTVETALRIAQEKGGACTEIRGGRSASHPALVMTDVCHGWRTFACGDMLFVEAEPVIEAQGQVLFVAEDKAVDLVALIDRAMDARWPGNSHLHLDFGAPRCDGATLVAPFTGSHMKRGASGSAGALQGRVRIVGPTRQVVELGKR
ncbi:hypothetical protein [Caulobacter sp. CCG-8]|uniref:hypothetical protein n=1 Tax=Caulobacter sp. CCG-8 TaxID=3127958 RepID=UPI00307E6FF7